MHVYSFDGSTGTKLAQPATNPAGFVNQVDWSRDGQFLAFAHATTPFMTVYQTDQDQQSPSGDLNVQQWVREGQ